MRIGIIGLLLLLLVSGCQEERKRGSAVASSKVKNVRLTFLNADQSKIVYGDTLKVQLSYDGDIAASTVVLKSRNETLPIEEIDSLVFAVPTQSLGGGYHGLRAEVMLTDSTAMRGSSSLRVLLPQEPTEWGYRLIETHPHDAKSYTQGLLYHDGWLYESAGRYGRSDIRKVNYRTGDIELKKRVEDEYFAEGLAMYNNQLYQLTWRENTVLVHDPESLERTDSFGYNVGNGEGWGLCFDGEHFILSDGSADISFIDPENWSEIHQVRVFDHQGDVTNLNELEYVGGKIYANILNDRRIAVIDPANGAVLAYWNLEGMLESQQNVGRVDVMNGIAYLPQHSSFLITGKLWPYLFEVAPVY